MAMKAKKLQPVKVEAIEAAKKSFEGYSDFIFADYRGLTVEQITALRRQLREKNCEFKVVKNNFAKLAFNELKVENVADYLVGPTAVALAKEDANEIAKIMFDFAKDAPALIVKGASIDNTIYDQAKIEAYSKLPGKTQLITMIACALNSTTQKFAATLQAVVDKKKAEGAN
ncbi:MAG: 50S ribosomal protein L10 [Spirochaetaceae bacterium]|nr:50S ribosomal protein L10 [Spirochaetaceae bacterium]